MPWVLPISVLFVALLGAIVGSFLNVVVYRLPRGLSVHMPRRSFCPACGQPIRALDNVPVISWLTLRGRCRSCAAPIPTRYPVVELLSCLVFVMVWDALFVGRVLTNLAGPMADWAPAAAFLVLFAALLAASAMDVEAYLIDVRLTHVAMIAGVAGGAAWGVARPFAATGGLVPDPAPGAVMSPAVVATGVALALGWGLTWLIALRSSEPEPGGPGDEPAATPETEAAPAAPRRGGLDVAMLLLAVAGVCVAVMLDAAWWPGGPLAPTHQRATAGLAILLAVMILASMTHRPADQVMEETIVAEQAQARGVAARELAWRLPAIGAAGGVVLALRLTGRLGLDWSTVEAWIGQRGAGLAAGLGQAVAGMMIAAAIGWTVRIGFTLLLGKEAFGVGDIYLMAAIGATGGVTLAVAAFFLGAMLALVGVLAASFRKRARALPFGPWLSLGALAGLWLRDGLADGAARTALGLWGLLVHGDLGGATP
ncbi:MAG: A24 family peptidase [Phycisphaerae bacterium]